MKDHLKMISDIPFNFSKNISLQDFRELGVHRVAYIRPIEVDNKTAYAIHAADGTTLSILENMEQALFIIQDNDLERAKLH